MKSLWLLRLIRTIVNQIDLQAHETPPTNSRDKRLVHTARQIRGLLERSNINES